MPKDGTHLRSVRDVDSRDGGKQPKERSCQMKAGKTYRLATSLPKCVEIRQVSCRSCQKRSSSSILSACVFSNICLDGATQTAFEHEVIKSLTQTDLGRHS